MAKKVIGYVRVSTETQDGRRQEEIINNYCISNGYELVEIRSEKKSGASNERREFNSLLSLTKDDCDIIAITEFSRFSRSNKSMNVLAKISAILDNGIYIAVTDNNYFRENLITPDISEGELFMVLCGVIGSYKEKDNIAQRMKSGKITMFNKTDKLMRIGSKIAYGFKAVHNENYIEHISPKTFIEVDEEKAEIVKRIYDMVIDGYSVRDIAKIFIKEGIKNDKGEAFKPSSLCKIIHNEIYKGIYKLNDNIKEFSPIVSPELWAKAQIILKYNNCYKEKNVINYNPLKGLIKCAVCGKSMTLVKNKVFYYRCASKKAIEVSCSNGQVVAFNVFNAVWHFIGFLSNEKEFKISTEKAVKETDKKINTIKEKYNSNIKAIEKYNKEMGNIENNMAKASPELYDKFNSIYLDTLKSKETAEKENAEYSEQIIKLKETKDKLKTEGLQLLFNNPTKEEVKEVFKKVIDFVSIKKVNNISFCCISLKNGLYGNYIIISKKKSEIYLMPDDAYKIEGDKIYFLSGGKTQYKDNEGNFVTDYEEPTENIMLITEYYKRIKETEINILENFSIPDVLKF